MKLRFAALLIALALLPIPTHAMESDLTEFFYSVSALKSNVSLMSVSAPRRLMVEFNRDASYDFKAERVIKHPYENYFVVQYATEAEAAAAREALLSEDFVTYADFDTPFTLDGEVAISSVADSNWGIKYTNAPAYLGYMESLNLSGTLTVAIVDTGCDMDHPYYASRLVPGTDIANGDSIPDDTYGHGTHVTGIVRAMTTDNVKIMPVKVFNGRTAYMSDIANGLEYAIVNGAKVVNMSLGGDHDSGGRLETLVSRAKSRRIAVICAAGNNLKDASDVCPAHIAACVTVTALTREGAPDKTFSNYGSVSDICAPGADIYSSYLNGTYRSMNGTSMAAPFVSAAFAMVFLRQSDLTVASATKLVLSMCVTPKDWDEDYGVGYLYLYPYEWRITGIENDTLSVTPNQAVSASPRLYAALYDADGTLISIESAAVTKSRSEYSFSFSDAAYLKAYIWDMGTMKPLCETFDKK